MLENLYTTKMSSNRKTLQNRFSKIRSEGGRFSKIMAAVMSAVVAVTMLCATVVMAAVGADGLEHWDKTEIYFRDGIDFSMNISGKEVPQWLKDDIAGNGDTVSFKLRNYEVRFPNGLVNYGGLAEVSGVNGTFVYPCEVNIGIPDGIGSSRYDKRDLNILYRETGASYFTGLSYEKRGFGGSGHIIASRAAADKYAADNNLEIGTRDNFDILFGFSEADELISVSFTAYYNVPKFYHIQAELASVKMIGGIENRITNEWELAPTGGAFASFEENYENISTEYADISVISADTQKIALKTEIKFEGNNLIYADVYKGKERIGTIRGEPHYGNIIINIDKTVDSGDKCRIDLYIMNDYNSNQRIIYRWQKYIRLQ
ncbi:MAG: hypothetical protein Q4G33_01630 [bacterium]|nr:hypothetical protein [bacterium]